MSLFQVILLTCVLTLMVTGHKSCSRNAGLMKSIQYQLKLVEDSDGKCDCTGRVSGLLISVVQGQIPEYYDGNSILATGGALKAGGNSWLEMNAMSYQQSSYSNSSMVMNFDIMKSTIILSYLVLLSFTVMTVSSQIVVPQGDPSVYYRDVWPEEEVTAIWAAMLLFFFWSSTDMVNGLFNGNNPSPNFSEDMRINFIICFITKRSIMNCIANHVSIVGISKQCQTISMITSLITFDNM
ncbi:unnamed protein product [Mytilus coruscus]|uniref:Uncharacterized protein n=1 Tax=Mytilus coruscus TaxID=42192 RepID=A0A6J8CGM4_MYTCO|nr:unnamed protein product [Mytilus coruscus]